jgi:hypothetical protein
VKTVKGHLAIANVGGRVELPEKEERPQLPVVVACEQKLDPLPDAEGGAGGAKKKERFTRLVVAGSASWVSNPYLDPGQSVNQQLAMNCLSYLLGQERFSREPVREADYKLNMEDLEKVVFSLVACPGLPFLAILLGITVWIVRRR